MRFQGCFLILLGIFASCRFSPVLKGGLVAGGLLLASLAHASTQLALNEEDLLVVQLSIGDYRDNEPLFIYRSPEQTLLPIGAIAQILNLAVETDVDTLSIEGWLESEQNTLDLDLSSSTLYVAGERQNWDEATRFAEDGFDIYLDQQTAQRILGLKFSVDVTQLDLQVQERAGIPLLEQLERQQARKDIESIELQTLPDDYIRNRYQWWSRPQFDFSIGTDLEHNRGRFSTRNNAVLQGRADLAKHALQASYVSNDGEDDLRLTLSRAAEGPDETIALGMDRYALGDLYGLSDPLLFSSVQGRGLRVARGGKSYLEQGDSITLQGDAPPGWEVELYRNGSLIEFSETTSDGRYVFEEVPVYIGENIFDVRLYGPQGQFREVREVVSAGGTMLRTGEWEFDAWALKRNKRLIDSSINSNEPETDFVMSEVRYGFNRYLSGRAGYASMTPGSNTLARDYWYTSLFAGVQGSLAQLHYAQDNAGGDALQVALQTRALGANVNLGATKFKGLISDRNESGNLDYEYNVRFDRSAFLGLPNAVLFDLEHRYREFTNNDHNSATSLRTSTGWAGYQFSNDLRYLNFTGSSSSERVDGQFSATRKWLGWRYKGGLDYSLSPVGRVSGLTFGASHRFTERLNYTGSITQRFEGRDVLSSDHTLTWGFERFSLSGSAGFNTQGFQYLGITLTSALGFNAEKSEYYFSSDSRTNSATLIARVFVDENNNGVFDDGESPVENVRFKGKSKWRAYKTDAKGVMVLPGIQDLVIETLEVDEKSIEDPFIKVVRGPVNIYTHAGATVYADIPVAMTFEIEGSVLVESEGELKPLNRVRVTLKDLEGNSIAKSRVEYDGVYLFSGLVAGDFCIAVNQEDVARLGLVSKNAETCFSADGSDGVVFAEDLTLKRQR